MRVGLPFRGAVWQADRAVPREHGAGRDGRGDQAAAVAAARDIDPPAELDEVWNDFLDGTVPFIEGDSSDADLIDRYLVAFGVVGAYAGSYCPLG